MSCQASALIFHFSLLDLYAAFDMGHMILFAPCQPVYIWTLSPAFLNFYVSCSVPSDCLILWLFPQFHSACSPPINVFHRSCHCSYCSLVSSPLQATEPPGTYIFLLILPQICKLECVFEPLFCQMPFQHFELSLLPFKKKKSCCKLQARILQNCT